MNPYFYSSDYFKKFYNSPVLETMTELKKFIPYVAYIGHTSKFSLYDGENSPLENDHWKYIKGHWKKK